jgi:hypothetical protein
MKKNVVEIILNSPNYRNFKSIIIYKKNNEEEARLLINNNIGNLNNEIIKKVIDLVDYSYKYEYNGKMSKDSPWFGRMISLNKNTVLSENSLKINQWFNVITNSKFSIVQKLNFLQTPQYRIKGLNVGFITLVLYLLEKELYSVWFEPQHLGLQKIYTNLGNFKKSKSEQYIVFNDLAKKLIKSYNLEDEELDWLLTYGINNNRLISFMDL